VVLTLGLACTHVALARDLWDRPWIEAHGEHYTVLSCVSEKDTIEVVEHLERFRNAAMVVLGRNGAPDRVRARMYLTPDRIPGVDVGVALTARGNSGALVYSKFEFDWQAKYLAGLVAVQNTADHVYPSWLLNGIAQVLTTVTTDGSTVEYGRPPGQWSRITAGVGPFDFDSRWTSWALLHYLMFTNDRDFADGVATFFELIAQGNSQGDAVEHAFAVDRKTLDVVVSRYAHRTMHYYRRPYSPPSAPVSTARLSRETAAVAVASLGLQFHQTDVAERSLATSLKLNPDNAKALYESANLRYLQSRYDEADALFRRAIALDPNDSYGRLDYGEFLVNRAGPTPSPDDLAQAREQLQRSLALAAVPETFAAIGSTYLFDGEPAATAVEFLTEAHSMLPADAWINLLLAKAYDRAGDHARALSHLRWVAIQSPNPVSDEGRSLLAKMNAR